MAKKKRGKRGKRKLGVIKQGISKAESKALRKARGAKHGKRVAKGARVAGVSLPAKLDVWKVQDALRKDGYFARAVGPHKIATNAPHV